jgi:transcriptional regulator with XRE-family HTH domain
MNRKEILKIFRSRLATAMRQADLNRAQLADRAGLDRSTLSQLMSEDNTRLPRADTLAALAGPLQISVDWLLGLSGEPRGGAAILEESLQIAPRPSEADENLAKWYEEAAGYKIRYVPTTLPDLVKTNEVIRYQFHAEVRKTPDQAIAASRETLAYSRLPETDLEVCMPRQALESFAFGTGIWTELEARTRIEQIVHMRELVQELYPSFRLYLYDGLTHYSAAYTIFGPLRAALFVGKIYFVFNTTAHVRVLTRHFDELIRAAVVQAHECGDFLETLEKAIEAGR